MTAQLRSRIENILVHISWTVILVLTLPSNWGRNSVLTETVEDRTPTRRKEDRSCWWWNISSGCSLLTSLHLTEFLQ